MQAVVSVKGCVNNITMLLRKKKQPLMWDKQLNDERFYLHLQDEIDKSREGSS